MMRNATVIALLTVGLTACGTRTKLGNRGGVAGQGAATSGAGVQGSAGATSTGGLPGTGGNSGTGGLTGQGGAGGSLTIPDAGSLEETGAAGADAMGGGPDLLGRDAGPDALDVPGTQPESGATDAASPYDVRTAAAVDGGPAPCTGTLLFGGVLPQMESGLRPVFMALGDLNGDGKLDLVTANWGEVGVLLGRGDGTFVAKTEYPMVGMPQGMALADLNTDGKLDVVVTSYDWVSVLPGKGDGTLGARREYATANAAVGLALGDLNGDGKVDVVTADRLVNTVNVFLNTGDGTLAARHDFPSGDGPTAVALGDLNGDGKLDLVVASDGSLVSVLLGKGDGTFPVKTDLPTGQTPSDTGAYVALGDVNGDGKLDLVASVVGSDVVAVLLGNGDGTFAASPKPGPDYLGGPLLLFDLNEDGKLDLIEPGAGIAFGQGDGTFAPTVQYRTGATTMALGDVNGDGRPDFAFAVVGASSGDPSTVGVMFGRGDGTFANYAYYPTASTSSPYPYRAPIALGDLDGDGKLDVARAITGGSSVDVLLGKDDGTFAAFVGYATGEEPESIGLGDLDGDGRLDIVTANTSADTVSVLLGMGSGTFAANVDYPTASSPTFVALGDVNGDGKLDIVTTNGTWKFTNARGTVSVLLGTGGGRFAAHVDYQAGVRPHSLALGDVNGDGALDVVVVNKGSEGYWSVGVLLGRGDGTFAVTPDVSTDGPYSMVAMADLDADGRLDLVMAGDTDDEVSVRLGKGNATFGAPARYQTPGLTSFALGDMNGDGKLDIVTAGSSGMGLLLGKGDGAFAPTLTYGVSSGTPALGDLDGDGRVDIVGAGYGVIVLHSSCSGP